MKSQFQHLKELIASDSDKLNSLYERAFSNMDNTQNKIIQYRKMLSLYIVFYFLAVIDHLNLNFINQYLKISQDNSFLTINSIERLIIILAPLFFATVYYLLILAKIHRSLNQIIINKVNDNDYISFISLHPFSAGLVRGFLNKLKDKTKNHKVNKWTELLYYITTIIISLFVLIYFLLDNLSAYNVAFILFSVFGSLRTLLRIKKETKLYEVFKKELVAYL